jgi:tetratricopeptide (TPR) repeat protein
MGKELYNNKDFSGALSKVKEAAATAKEYGVEEVTNEANELLPTISLAYGTDAMKNKDYATAVSAFQDAVDADTTNGMASLLLGQALSASGKTDEAIEAYKSAANNGKADVAGKQISIIYLKQAATSLKSKNYEKAESLAEEALKYDDNAQAYLVAGQAASALKDNKSAISNYEKYLEAAPNSKNYNAIAYTVAALYQTSGNKTKAVEYYKKVVNDAKFGATAKKMIASLSN